MLLILKVRKKDNLLNVTNARNIYVLTVLLSGMKEKHAKKKKKKHLENGVQVIKQIDVQNVVLE